ncbi:MAG: SusD/RagB family nutrient-binding outer membrane lipoprotein [Bacteroidales bacterium]|jgi:hypothetical protein
MKKLIILLTAILVLGSACKKSFLDIDVSNPNSASTVPVDLVLPAALSSVTTFYANPRTGYEFIALWYGWWSVSQGYSQPSRLLEYLLINSSYQGFWQDSYETLANLDYIEKNSTTTSMMSYRAIAKIMKVYLYQNLVDMYGDIPYSQALQTSQGILKPAYDKQQTIYEDLVVQLDTAMNIIAKTPASATSPASNDIIYKGNMQLWAKFANTLKLRMLMNQSGMANRSAYINQWLATTASVGYLGAGEGAWLNPGYIQSATKMNPFWEYFYKQDNSLQADALQYYMAGQDAVDFLTNTNDPRLSRLFAPIANGTFAGNYFGASSLKNTTSTSKLGPGLFQAYNQNSPVLTDIESLFLQAEAAERGYLTGADPQALYESAVTQSIIYFGQTSYWDAAGYVPLSSVDAATYLAQSSVPLASYTASTNKLQTIFTQKWIAMMGIDPFAMFTDYRRTGYPDFIHWSQDLSKQNPTPCIRLLYPQTEIATNDANMIAVGTINPFTSKIFWQNR